MAQAGFTPIQLYHSSTPTAVPAAGDMQQGELALNIADGRLYFKNASNVVTLLAVAGGAGAGTVTSVAASGGTTGLTFSGSPITTTGTLTLGGTLGTNNGGTGQTTYTNGQLLIGNTSTGGLTKATLTAGSGVTITNGAGTITIAATGGGGGGVSSVTATFPATSTGGGTPDIGIAHSGGACTTTTGTGALVFATAPSITLTNATGLPLTTGVTGVLPSVNGGVPSGAILMWSGSILSIPSGWFLCDGNNGTPDLRNRFIVGAGSTYAVAATGGSANATLVSHSHTFSGSGGGTTDGALGNHNHTFSGTTGTAGAHTHTITDPGHTHPPSSGNAFVAASGSPPGGQFASSLGDAFNITSTGSASTGISINSAGDHTHSFSGTTANTNLSHSHTFGVGISGSTSTEGSSATNANLPPYYALAYIMKS